MTSNANPFAFGMLQRVLFREGGGECVVIERTDRAHKAPRYRVRFLNEKGQPKERGVAEAALMPGGMPVLKAQPLFGEATIKGERAVRARARIAAARKGRRGNGTAHAAK